MALRQETAWQDTQMVGIHTFCPLCHSRIQVGIQVVPPLGQSPRCHGFEGCQDYFAGCQDQSPNSVLLRQGHGRTPKSLVLDNPKHLPRPLDKECSFYRQRLDRCLLMPCSESPLCSQVLGRLL